jgi:8-oxo-(d)GTP phosphatase
VIVLLRHAAAGNRQKWEGDDRLRPLSERGREQARLLVAPLAALEVTSIVSSPYLRCTQTVEPLARELGLAIEESDALAEGAAHHEALRLAQTVPAGAVLCTHGDVVEALLEAGLKKGAAALLDVSSSSELRLIGSVSAP